MTKIRRSQTIKKHCYMTVCDIDELSHSLSIPEEMIELVVCVIIFWVLSPIETSQESSVDSGTFLEKKKRSTPRGYYGYPFVPYAEPLTILAGLAFLAYIIQTFHALYHQHHGLGGGVLNNVLPNLPKSGHSLSRKNNQSEIID